MRRSTKIRHAKVRAARKSADNAAKITRVEGFRKSADDAARNVRTVYVTLLGVWAYLAIIVGSTTDEQLLRGSVVILPVIQLGLPIVGFYVVAPLLFVLLHLNLLIQHQMLARKLRDFGDAADLLNWDDEQQERRKLFPLPFSHLLEGSDLEGGVWRLMVYISLITLPIVLLLGFQIWFIAYQNVYVTWWHRLLLASDLVLIWVIWPSLGPGGKNRQSDFALIRQIWQQRLRFDVVYAVVLTAIVLLISFGVATVRGGSFDWTNYFEKRQQLPRTLKLPERTLVLDTKLPDVVKAYEGIGKKRDLIPRKLYGGLDLRNRNLRGANLAYAKLYNADLRKADLQGADLRGARMQGSNLQGAKLQGAILLEASFPGVDFRSARLQGADLRGARLQGANLRNARLQGADLRGARLQGANLRRARLQGADLSFARLEGADLSFARLEGANLRGAKIAGANFNASNLRLADLRKVILEPLSSSSWDQIRNKIESEVPAGKVQAEALERIKGARTASGSLFTGERAPASMASAICDPSHNCSDRPKIRTYALKVLEFLLESACIETGNRFTAAGFSSRLGRELAGGWILSDELGPIKFVGGKPYVLDLEADARVGFAKRLLACPAANELPQEMRDKLTKLAKRAPKTPAGKKAKSPSPSK